ncbi:ankyrin repeat-containing domain protein [Blakeslea trispora]|nr:ankyrin repeat-containing domain protein [Blakeslea trispora]
MNRNYDGKKDHSLGLHSAAMNGNVGLVKFALDHGAPIDAVVNGYMPLQLACINENHIAVVQYLIDRGADVNAQRWSKKHSADKSQAVAGAIGSTALHVACANGCTKIVDLLLRNGAKINVRDKYGSRPIDVAAAKNHTEIVKLLETFGSMQVMLKGLQEGKNNVLELHSSEQQQQQQQQRDVVYSRRSMDVSLYQQQKRAERLRRPSLPSVFESRKLNIPDISTLPTLKYHQDLRKQYTDEPGEEDWYSYGVVNHYDDENYLASLERRAYGLPSPHQYDVDEKTVGRASLDCTRRRPSVEPAPLKRCSSTDGHHLRATALMNAMAANNISLQDDEQGNLIFSIDAYYPAGRPSLESSNRDYRGRTSLDFRPSLDSLSQLAKKSIDGLSRKSVDGLSRKSMDFDPALLDDYAKKTTNRGFLSKWWSNNANTNRK